MNKQVIVKIAVILIVPVLVLTAALYFLYPYLNEEKYRQIVSSDSLAVAEETVSLPDTLGADLVREPGGGFGEMESILSDSLKQANRRLAQRIDSLQAANRELEQQLKASRKKPESGSQAVAAQAGVREPLPSETFGDRVKSLLNLEVRELSPIINQMSDKQLVRLYGGASSMQREKILRSLQPERAAKLMSEIMLR